jgi:predicted nucleic acid-binding protein
MGEGRGLLTEQQTGRFLRDLTRVAIIIDGIPDEPAALTLARRRRLTVYDSAYLEVAVRRDLPLATLDGELARAAQAEQAVLISAEIR